MVHSSRSAESFFLIFIDCHVILPSPLAVRYIFSNTNLPF
nr:MAG TPA: hypothetical protein [Caudoviricetes sp.]